MKAGWSNSNRRALRENGYWLGQLRAADVSGTDPEAILAFDSRIAALTPEQLKQTAQRYFDMNNYVQAVLYPAAAAPAAAPAGAK